jgi:hypothetical protein
VTEILTAPSARLETIVAATTRHAQLHRHPQNKTSLTRHLHPPTNLPSIHIHRNERRATASDFSKKHSGSQASLPLNLPVLGAGSAPETTTYSALE